MLFCIKIVVVFLCVCAIAICSCCITVYSTLFGNT